MMQIKLPAPELRGSGTTSSRPAIVECVMVAECACRGECSHGTPHIPAKHPGEQYRCDQHKRRDMASHTCLNPNVVGAYCA